jgi:hypothetical protein
MAKYKVTIETPTTRHKHVVPKKKATHKVKHRFDSDKRGQVWLPMANYFNEASDTLEGRKEGKEPEVKFWGQDWAGVDDKEDEGTETEIWSGEVPKKFEIKSERQATTLERPFANIPEDEETKGIPTYSQEYGLEGKKGVEEEGFDVFGFVGRKLEEQSEKARKEVYGNMLKDIAEKGAFYKPSSWAGDITYNNLKKQGFASEDEFGRPFVTDKGKDLLKEWKISYTEKSREPKFEEKKDEKVEKIVTEAGKEDLGITPRKEEEATAEELVAEVSQTPKAEPKVEIIPARKETFGEKVKEAEEEVVEKAKEGVKKVKGWFKKK